MRTVVCLLFVLGAAARAAAQDEFSQYPAEPPHTGAPASAVLDTKAKQRFAKVLRDEATESANFNGHYRIAYWGCGANCIFWAVINQKTGAVWMAPKNVQSCWPFKKADDPAAYVPDWFESQVQSRLFYSYDCTNPDGNFTFNRKNVYVWKNGQPRLLRSEAVDY